MDACPSLGCGDINFKVANLAEKVVLVDIPVAAVIVVGVRVDDCHALEAGRRLKCWRCNGIADELSVVVLDNGLADDIGARREVNESRNDCRGVTALATTVAIRDGSVDCFGIVGRTVSFGTIVLDVAENLKVARAKSDTALSLDAGKPVWRCRSSCQA